MVNFLARLSQALQKNKTSPSGSAESGGQTSKSDIGIGTLINQRYRLEAEIGRGGMGVVYRAHDIPNHRQVALKIINAVTANDLTSQQFSRETQITTQLNHPHIVAVYEAGTVDFGARPPLPFMVMELIQGTGLDEMHGLTFARIIDIGKQICDALEYAHNQGFVHRDLKPGNVLIEKRGFQYFAKLMDFGLARPRGETYLSTESNLAGSFFYLAPEVIAGQPADIASDLYALGAMLYEIITGRAPFSNFDEQTILLQHLEEAAAPPSHSRHNVPPALEAIVLRLLEKNPMDRFVSAQEVRQALEQVIPERDPDAVVGNLPQVSADLSGQDHEIAQIKLLIESSRLVTCLGGDEKFDLILAVGAQLADQFSDGVWLMDLKALSDPSLLVQTAASVLGVREDPHRALTISLVETLREKNILLLFSRCDHVLGACAQLIESVLSTSSEVRILAICHQPLNIPAEKCYRAENSASAIATGE